MLTDAQIRHRNAVNRAARAFLHDQLADGPQLYSLLRQRARAAGVSITAMTTAKHALHVESRSVDDRAMWSLPTAI